MGNHALSTAPEQPHLDVVIDAKSQFIALACAACDGNRPRNRDDVTTTTRFRNQHSKNNSIRGGRCDAHVIAVVGSLMRFLGENHVVRAHRHMVMSLEATSSAEGGRARAVRLHVWIGVSPTLGVVHSHLSVAGVRCFFVSHISVCSGYGGKPARQFVIVNDTGTEFVLQVTDNCGKVQCKLAKGWMDMRLLECNTKWIVVGCQDHMEVMRINPHCWMVPPCGNEEVILSRLEDNTCCGPVSVPYREGVWYMQGIFNVEKEDEILLVDGSTHGSSCLVDLNATFKTKSLVVIYYTWIPSASKGSVVLKGTIHTISPQVPPASFKLYNTETKAHIHTFPEGSTIAAVGPDCICETTTTGTHNIFHVTSLDTPLHSLANTTILTTDPLSGVLATTTKTHSSKTTAAPVLTVTFLDALTRTVLAVLSAPQMSKFSMYNP